MKSHAAALALLGKPARKRARKAKLAPSLVEHDCVVLAVDTARRSGWCVRSRESWPRSRTIPPC